MTTRKFSTANLRPALFALYQRKNRMFKKSISTLKLVTLLALGLSALASTPAHAAGPTPINACQTLSTPGNYALTKNLTASGDCLVLTSNNINIDLAGHTISGDGSGRGIGGNNVRNIVINDGKIKNFATGISLTLSSCCTGDNTIQNMNVSNNTGGGILVDGCCNTFSNIVANSNSGIGLRNNDCRSPVTNGVTNRNGGDGMDLLDCCYV